MLTSQTIELVKDVTLSTVIGRFIDLKKKGVNYEACCPFHSEKSPSFHVNDVKEIYKCFGCGCSGDAINFVMEHENQTFTEAVVTIADIAGIAVEYEKVEYTAAEKEKLSAAELQETVLNHIVPIYQKQLHLLPPDHPAKLWLYERGIGEEEIAEWQLGWSPEEWRFITPILIEKGWFEPAFKQGIVRTGKNNNHYDGYRSRIIFPITNRNGRYIGLGGRFIAINNNEGKDIPKYINPADSELYNKSTVLFGLNKAAKAIKTKGCVQVVEGYMDVISAHVTGKRNTVGSCGTAFTKEQMRLVKKHTNNLDFWMDNDGAGVLATYKSIPEAVKLGFQVHQIVYPKKDPDEYCRSHFNLSDRCIVADKANYIKKNQSEKLVFLAKEDAIIWYVNELWKEDEMSITDRAAVKEIILKLLASVPNEILRNNYLDNICKMLRWKPTDTKKEFATIMDITPDSGDRLEEEGSSIKFPSWVSDEMKEAVMQRGYLEINRKEKGKPQVGYYAFTQNGKTEITNFIVTPLFRIEAGRDSRYLSEINNGYKKAILDIPARIIPSISQFEVECIGVGGSFLIYGSSNQWKRIATDLLHQYPSCIEITELGWQKRYNFFAYVDKAYLPKQGIQDLNEYGIIKHNDVQYIIPAGSAAYMALKESGTDPYEHLRYLSYKKNTIDFKQWSEQMFRVYKNKGIVGIAYAILTIFRDIVFAVDNNCPHLYGFGEPSSGKSKWAESICAIFYENRSAFNLNSSTDFAFFLYMGSFANCPAHLNEFDIEVIRMEWFEAIKGAYDGEGRMRGKLGVKNATEIQKIVSTLILTGQKLITYNDNSVVTRSIIEGFSKEEYTQEDGKAYDQLKAWEKQGLNGIITEILELRPFFEANYKNNLNKQLSKWRKEKVEARGLNQRVLTNFATILTCYSMLNEHITMPKSVFEFEEYCYNQAIYWNKFIELTDTLSEFWKTLESLNNNDLVIDGWDFIVEPVWEVSIRTNRTETTKKTFEAPTKVLFLRVNNVHKLFQKDYRSRTGKEAMTLENVLHYFNSRKYFLGPVKQKQFSRFITASANIERRDGLNNPVSSIETRKEQEIKVTSCYAFLYEDLEIDIGKQLPTQDDTPF